MVRHRRLHHKRLTFNILEQEHILNTHIDTLTQWYADAERITDTNLPRIGDTLIFPYNAGGFGIEVEEDGWTPDMVMTGEPIRILVRAPKPKPAWHDAVAILTRSVFDETDMYSGRRVMTRAGFGDGRWWDSSNEKHWEDDELADVTPLIEAKVTDEMRARAIAAYEDDHGSFAARIDATLAAALGIEAE